MAKKKIPKLGKKHHKLSPKTKAIRKAAKLGASEGYGIRLYQRKSQHADFEQVPLNKFRKRKDSLVYLYKRGTRKSMLLARGKLDALPVATKKYIETFGKGRVFFETSRPKFGRGGKTKARGAWVPIHKFYGIAKKRFASRVREFRKEGYKARGAILPLKRYYHPKWEIFSDAPIRKDRKVTVAYANVIAAFDYPGQHWIGQRHIRVEFPRGIALSNLHKYTDRVQSLAGTALHATMPKASDVQVLEVNGYIPIEFKNLPAGRHGKRRK